MDSKLYYGDNLAMLEYVRDESVDLIYLDPPFNSKATYNVLFKTPTGDAAEAQAEAFLDTWTWGPSADAAYEEVMNSGRAASRVLSALFSAFGKNDMMAYLAMMTVRLEEMHRKLKPTGSLYLHCDPTASHYLKIILDGIFGAESFKNEIIWKRTGSHGGAKRWGDIHDSILFYAMSENSTWNRVLQAHDETYLDVKYRFTDDRGRYRLVVLTGPGTTGGASGKPWRGYNPTVAGRHWAVPKRAIEVLREEGVKIPDDLHEQLELLYQHGFIRFPQKKNGALGVPEFKLYLPKGQPIQDMILDIPPINSQAKERLGYPTQKPLALLKRLIEASSNEGDVVLDPFCGCGTAVEAAQSLRRKWIGIDITHYAVSLIEARMKRAFPEAAVPVDGRPGDYEAAMDLAARNKYQFQWWVNWLLQVQNYRERKKGADQGIDGVIYFPNGPKGIGRIIISVKAGENLNVSMVRDLHGTMSREAAEMGVIVTAYEPTSAMIQEARRAGIVRTAPGTYPKIQVLWIKDWFDGRRPELPRAFEPEKLRLAGRPKDRDVRQLGFTFEIKGGKGGKKRDEVIHTDPRTAFAMLDAAD